MMPHTSSWLTAQKARTLTTASASGCRACYTCPTDTTSWKRKNHKILTAGFQLVERIHWTTSARPPFEASLCFATDKWGRISDFSYLCPVLRTWEGALSWLYYTKTINSPQFIEILKVKRTSISKICKSRHYFVPLDAAYILNTLWK